MRGVLERVIAFVGLAAILTAIPGPAIVLIMKSSLLRGRRGAAMTAFGVFGGDLVWVTTSLLGLTALLVAYRPAFEVLRFVGAAYLIYLGVRLLFGRGGDPLAVGPIDATPDWRRGSAGLAVCLVYAAVLGTTGRAIRRPRLARGLMRGSGGALVVFGGALAVEGLREV